MTKLDQFHHHELLDRTYLIQTMIEQFLQNHPAITQKHSKLLDNIQSNLSTIYQEVGNSRRIQLHKEGLI